MTTFGVMESLISGRKMGIQYELRKFEGVVTSGKCQRALQPVDHLPDLALQEVISVFGSIRAIYGHFEDLLAEVAATCQDGSDTAEFCSVLLPFDGLGRLVIFPSAIEDVQLKQTMTENILMKGKVDALNRKHSDTEIVL